MVTPIIVLLWLGALFALYRYLITKNTSDAVWRAAFTVGFIVGVVRGALSSLGWYGVEQTGGPLQVPAFALSLLAWPEAVLLAQRRGIEGTGFYVSLVLLLILTSLLLAIGVATIAQVRRPRDV